MIRKKDVQIGAHYAIKHGESIRLSVIRIVRVSPYGGWEAKKLSTGKTIRIKSAAKLRHKVALVDGDWSIVE